MTLLPTVSSHLLSAMLMTLERNSSSGTDPGAASGSPHWIDLGQPPSGFVNLREHHHQQAPCREPGPRVAGNTQW